MNFELIHQLKETKGHTFIDYLIDSFIRIIQQSEEIKIKLKENKCDFATLLDTISLSVTTKTIHTLLGCPSLEKKFIETIKQRLADMKKKD